MEPTPKEKGRGSGRLWLGLGVALVVGLLVGGLVVSVTTPRAPPEATFTVVAYHWGFAVYDAEGNEVPKIEVARGTVVTLLVVGASALNHEIHEAYEMRTIQAWENNSAYGNKNGTAIMMEMEMAGAQGLLDHSVTISAFNVNVVTDRESPSPQIVTFVADQAGAFDIQCQKFCGWGHQYMELAGGLVVT